MKMARKLNKQFKGCEQNKYLSFCPMVAAILCLFPRMHHSFFRNVVSAELPQYSSKCYETCHE